MKVPAKVPAKNRGFLSVVPTVQASAPSIGGALAPSGAASALAVIEPEPADRPAQKRRRKARRKHPGVVLMKPDASHGWRARYVDVDTGRTVKEPLAAGLTDVLREDWCVRKSQALMLRRLALEGGAVRATGAELAVSVAQYFDDHLRLRPRTREIYKRTADRLVGWCDRMGISSADRLDGPSLVKFRAHLIKVPLRSRVEGKRGATIEVDGLRAPATINQELRAIGTVLTYLRRLGLLPKLTSDAIKDSLQKLPVGLDRIDFRKPSELRALLDAAVRHDAETFAETRAEHESRKAIGTTPRYKPILPLVIAAMLTGMRIGELLGLTWERTDLEAGEIFIGSESKTHRARTVDLSVAPPLWEMLRRMRPAHSARGRSVFGLTRGEANKALRRLRKSYGAPKGCEWQALRRTAGTYLTNAPGIFGGASAYRSARQLGHSVAVAERHYLGVVRVSPDARTLEAAMGVEEHEAIASRAPLAAGASPALEAKQVTADAVSRD